MGADRYCPGRETMSKDPAYSGTLETEKHWYAYLLWGRMGYDPNTPTSLLKGLIKYRFPGIDENAFYSAFETASKIIPLVNKFHWYSWDFRWWAEGCHGNGDYVDGMHDLEEFIKTETVGDPYIAIPDYVNGQTSGETPVDVANDLAAWGNTALNYANSMTGPMSTALAETITDITCHGYLGLYYAHKIRAAIAFQRLIKTGNNTHRTEAVRQLELSLNAWNNYINTLDARYIIPNIAGHKGSDTGIVWKDGGWWDFAGAIQKDINKVQNY